MLLGIVVQELPDQPFGITVIEYLGSCFFSDDPDQVLNFVGDPPGTEQNADQLSFIIGNRKFPQGPGTSADDDNDIGCPDIDHFPAHEAAAGKNQDLMKVCRRFVLAFVFPKAQPGGDAYDQTPTLLGSPGRFIGKSGAGPGHGDAAGFSDSPSQVIGRIFLLPGHLAAGTAHNPDF